jgi:RimJ/RimL family protein N-acetyltransferase
VAGAVLRLEPVSAGHESAVLRFLTEPAALGLDWSGPGDVGAFRARLAADGYQGQRDGLLAVVEGDSCVGEVSWHTTHYGGAVPTWRIGVAILPEARGRGLARAAQRLLVRHLFDTTEAQRVEAVVRVDNTAEHHALEAIGFTRDAVLARARHQQGAWHDVVLFSRLRD